MAIDPPGATVSNWRAELPVLTSRLVTLREPAPQDLSALVDLLSASDASRFGIDDAISELSVSDFLDRVLRDRSAGVSFTFVIVSSASRAVVGLAQVRQLDIAFETAEWEFTIVPSARSTGAFIESARLVGSFAFGSVGVHRLESRVLLQNGRANGALRKLGAVQEGLLRRSIRRNGEYMDQVLWSVLKEDWGAHWTPTGSRVH